MSQWYMRRTAADRPRRGQSERLPAFHEAVERLAHLEAHGPSPVAFGFAQPFGPDGRPLPRGTAAGDTCPAV